MRARSVGAGNPPGSPNWASAGRPQACPIRGPAYGLPPLHKPITQLADPYTLNHKHTQSNQSHHELAETFSTNIKTALSASRTPQRPAFWKVTSLRA